MIFVSSNITKNSSVGPQSLLYAATKGAVEQFSRVLAKDLGARGITVNTISPGATATSLFLESFSQEIISRAAESHPAKRIAQPEDIAPIVAFLARDEAHWVNGQNIYVNNVRDYRLLSGGRVAYAFSGRDRLCRSTLQKSERDECIVWSQKYLRNLFCDRRRAVEPLNSFYDPGHHSL